MGGGRDCGGGYRAFAAEEESCGDDRNCPPLLRISGHLGALNAKIQKEASY